MRPHPAGCPAGQGVVDPAGGGSCWPGTGLGGGDSTCVGGEGGETRGGDGGEGEGGGRGGGDLSLEVMRSAVSAVRLPRGTTSCCARRARSPRPLVSSQARQAVM